MNKGDGWTDVSGEELYQLIWGKPIHTLSKEFGISDVGLAKICKRNNIPRPERGYWARLHSGQKIKGSSGFSVGNRAQACWGWRSKPPQKK